MSNSHSAVFSPAPLTLMALIFMAALSRLIPHPPNFSPLEAMALFGGAYFAKRSQAVWVPLLALLLSDLGLSLMMGGDYRQYIMSGTFILVYSTMAFLCVLGFALRGKVSVTRVLAYSLLSSVIFFLSTNFGAWLSSGLYPHTAAGLGAAYLAGLPFFQYGLISTLFYSAVLFGGFEVLKQRLPYLAQTRA